MQCRIDFCIRRYNCNVLWNAAEVAEVKNHHIFYKSFWWKSIQQDGRKVSFIFQWNEDRNSNKTCPRGSEFYGDWSYITAPNWFNSLHTINAITRLVFYPVFVCVFKPEGRRWMSSFSEANKLFNINVKQSVIYIMRCNTTVPITNREEVHFITLSL